MLSFLRSARWFQYEMIVTRGNAGFIEGEAKKKCVLILTGRQMTPKLINEEVSAI